MASLSELIRAKAAEAKVLRPIYMGIPKEEGEGEMICFASALTPLDTKKLTSYARIFLSKSKGIDEKDVDISGLDVYVFTIIQKLKANEEGTEPAFSQSDADSLYNMPGNWVEHIYEQIMDSPTMDEHLKNSGKTQDNT